MNTVVRDGNTVVRIAGPWTATVHRYLQYLHVAGVDWILRPLETTLGADGHPERERLTYLHGDALDYPLPSWVWADHVLSEGGKRLRRLHDASIGFSSDGCVWQSPAKIPADVICHNDFAPPNLVFRDGRITGAIDFDFCSPGPRVWDIAYFATRAVPLTAETPEGAPGMDQARRRVEIILDAYGSKDTITVHDVVRVAIIRLHDLADLSRRKAEELNQPDLAADATSYDRDGRYLATTWR